MSWIVEIAKMLVLCAATAFVLALANFIPPFNNSTAIGLDLVLRITGARLALVGGLNLGVGLLLTRLTVFGDAAGKLHVNLR